jgi:coatomer protein complex subunit gamma
MIYLVIKELRVGPDESLIVVACLSKDMTSKTDLFRANAIRALARIMEVPASCGPGLSLPSFHVFCVYLCCAQPSMLAQMERFLKQAVVDKNPFM